MSELTDWFSGGIKPKRKGVYEMKPGPDHIHGGDLGSFQYWDGKSWRGYAGDPETAANISCKNYLSKHQKRQWRGLANNPKKGKK